MKIDPKNIAVIGCSGAIGSAFAKLLAEKYPKANLHKFSRTGEHSIDYANEESIENTANVATENGKLDIVIVAIGILQDGEIKPEKSLRELSAKNFQHMFAANTIAPALITKHFLPKLNNEQPAIFAVLSASVGSISQNNLGGWYAYRASKAALNMVLKNASIELARRNKQAIVVGLHPGTVDSNLSKPFQNFVAKDKLFTADFSVAKLYEVLGNITPQQSGKCFSYNGKVIEP